MDSNHRSEDATDLQSAPIGHSGTLPYSINGAGGRIRTPDLLITKCIQTLHLTVFKGFGAFPFGILRTFLPIGSTVSTRSFSNMGQYMGQEILSEKMTFSRSVTPCAD